MIKNETLQRWELVNFCEFDKYAVQSYCAIHNIDESLNLGDINNIDENNLKSFNMICGGSPCQDFSIAGGQKGSIWTCHDCGQQYNPLTVHYSKRDKCPYCDSKNIEKTRSSLLVEYLRVVRANNPNFGIYENVRNIVGKKFKETTFKLLEEELHEYGYNTYWKILNSKNFGIPQDRERVYLLFIKKELDNDKFTFPNAIELTSVLKSILEDEVEEKYYVDPKLVQRFVLNDSDNGNVVGYLEGNLTKTGKHQSNQVMDINKLSPTLYSGMYKNPFKFVNGEICRTVRSSGRSSIDRHSWDIVFDKHNKRIRKLTPKECFRLMGFSDEQFQKAKDCGVSNTQLYKQAGNSIVTNVLYYIFKELYMAMPYLFEDLKVSSFFSGIGAFEAALDRLYEEIIN